MAPPAKRRKRNAVSLSSDDEDDEAGQGRATGSLIELVSSSPVTSKSLPNTPSKKFQSTLNMSPIKAQPKAKISIHPGNAAPICLPNRGKSIRPGNKRPSASVSPEKAKGGKGKQNEKGKSRDIFTLFSTQAQKQRASTASHFADQNIATVDEFNDEISDDDDVGEVKGFISSVVGTAARKRSSTKIEGEADVVSGSQRFLRMPTSTRPEEDLRPWAERFAPTSLDELCVHKKKVVDVRSWLVSVMEGRLRQRVLVVKGAAGTGKTTTLQLLAKNMDIDILEWRNPVGSVASSDGFVSMAAQFEEFIGRGGKFGQLDIFYDDAAPSSKPDTKPLDRRKSMILVEEFPNTFMRSSTGLQSFRSAILQYLAANTPPLSMMYNKQTDKEPITPLILVISETLLTTSSASADSFTAHRLLGQEVLQHPGVTVIEFNAIAPTLLAKALELIVIKESRKSGRRKTPGPSVLKRLGEIGDVRSAIGSLEFLCVRGDENSDWGAKVAFTKGKKANRDAPMTKMESESLELVSRREASLGIFHAVGKVVYNKRHELARSDDVEKLPEWMSDRARPKQSQVSVDELIDETGTDTQTFVAALHENYLLSCDASTTTHEFSDLDHVNGCIDAMSDCDLLCPSWDGSFNSTGFGGGTGGRGSGGDILRQDELCFQIAVRGILFSLPCPVKRRAPPQSTGTVRPGRGGDAFKLFYPTSLKLWRAKEEIESTIDLWVTRLMQGHIRSSTSTISSAAAFANPKPGSVESWKNNNSSIAPADNDPPDQNDSKDNDDNPTLLPSTGISARKEMLLERLPYMAMIAKVKQGGTSPLIRDMEKVTAFTGIGGPTEEDEGDEAPTSGGTVEDWATDKPVEEGEVNIGRRPRVRGKTKGIGTIGLEKRFAEQKLVLSDDDIEDD